MKIKLGSLKVESFVTSLPAEDAKMAKGGENTNPPITIVVEDSGSASYGQPGECSYSCNTYMTGCGLNTCQQTCGYTWTGCWC